MKKKKAVRSSDVDVFCHCGGRLRHAILPEHDLAPYVGLEGKARNIPGLRCTGCGGESLEGDVIAAVIKLSVVNIAQIKTRLSSGAARFLRRAVGMTQAELATRMSINRVTVAKWECDEEPISPQHDMLLRVLVLSPLASTGQIPQKDMASILEGLGAVRVSPPQPIEKLDIGWPSATSKTKRHASAL
jgi:DNA-binding transcriptional regulator YiaG